MGGIRPWTPPRSPRGRTRVRRDAGWDRGRSTGRPSPPSRPATPRQPTGGQRRLGVLQKLRNSEI